VSCIFLYFTCKSYFQSILSTPAWDCASKVKLDTTWTCPSQTRLSCQDMFTYHVIDIFNCQALTSLDLPLAVELTSNLSSFLILLALRLLVPGPAGLTLCHLPGCIWLYVTCPVASDFSSLNPTFGLPYNLLPHHPSILNGNFRPPKCQMPLPGEIPFTYPISYAMPILYSCLGNWQKQCVAIGQAANRIMRNDAFSTLVHPKAHSALQRS
jgi:hypothetical protein